MHFSENLRVSYAEICNALHWLSAFRNIIMIVTSLYHLLGMLNICLFKSITTTETNIAEFANSVDLDEVAHNEPPHQDLHCLPSSL